MNTKIQYPLIILEETENFIKTYKNDDKKSFEIKIDTFFENLKFKIKELDKKKLKYPEKPL